jgi:3-hydroxyisobutyrate dehydrogenase
MPRIGFVGLGVMGGPMAGHLARKAAEQPELGIELRVWNRSPEKAQPFREQGIAVAESLESLGRWAEITMLCVSKTEDVLQCLAALTANAPKGALFIDHSTIEPKAAMELYQELGAKGFRFIDAPITGGSMGAKNGTLTIFCGGQQADLDEAMPFLTAYGKTAELVGGPGAGQMMKMVNQIAVAGALQALCESLAFAQKAGLDLSQTRRLVGGGAAGSWAFENYGPKILNQDWSPGFSIDNQVKDLDYCESTAASIGASIPGTQLVNQLLKQMQQDGRGGQTTAALFEQLVKVS